VLYIEIGSFFPPAMLCIAMRAGISGNCQKKEIKSAGILSVSYSALEKNRLSL